MRIYHHICCDSKKPNVQILFTDSHNNFPYLLLLNYQNIHGWDDKIGFAVWNQSWMWNLTNVFDHIVFISFECVFNVAILFSLSVFLFIKLKWNESNVFFLYLRVFCLPNIILIVKFVKQYVNYEHTNGGSYELQRQKEKRNYSYRIPDLVFD